MPSHLTMWILSLCKLERATNKERRNRKDSISTKQNGHCNQTDDRSSDELDNLNNEENGRNEEFEHANLKVNSRTTCNRLALVMSGLAATSSLLVLILIAVAYGTCINHRHEEITSDAKPTTYPEVCIDCLKLVKNPYKQPERDDLLDGLTKIQEDGVVKCCAGNSTQMSSLLEAVMREQETMPGPMPETVFPDRNSAPVSVHKLMVSENAHYFGETKSSTKALTVLKFDPNRNDSLTEHVRGVTVLDNGLVVMVTGYYFVYSSVSYRPSVTSRERNLKHQNWFSYVRRTRPNSVTSTGILLTSVHTSCDTCRQDIETAFTGGVFLLKTGDLMQVFLSEKGLVTFGTQSTYLGMVMLGSK